MGKRLDKRQAACGDIYVTEFTSDKGNQGFRACCPAIPGLVFRHRSEEFSVWMVAISAESVLAHDRDAAN